ncbi:MAG: protein tyrosine/serine phosphatase [Acidobacteria bacterium]|nr:protein tyrosine/serine phosphatase [Acidobacteriota bacterium]
MNKNSKKSTPFLHVFAILTLIVGMSAIAFAQEQNSNSQSSKIKNFGRMDERFYRGAQPKEGDYQSLASLGIKTVIDLRDDPESYEKRDVEALGMRYVNIPMSDKDYPRAEQITSFLKLTGEPATGKFFVHCAGGRHRTGVMGAVYRFTHDHWNYDQVYAEMKTYDFYTRFGHGAMKKYVEDYWQQLQTASPGASAVKAVTSQDQ